MCILSALWWHRKRCTLTCSKEMAFARFKTSAVSSVAWERISIWHNYHFSAGPSVLQSMFVTHCTIGRCITSSFTFSFFKFVPYCLADTLREISSIAKPVNPHTKMQSDIVPFNAGRPGYGDPKEWQLEWSRQFRFVIDQSSVSRLIDSIEEEPKGKVEGFHLWVQSITRKPIAIIPQTIHFVVEIECGRGYIWRFRLWAMSIIGISVWRWHCARQR